MSNRDKMFYGSNWDRAWKAGMFDHLVNHNNPKSPNFFKFSLKKYIYIFTYPILLSRDHPAFFSLLKERYYKVYINRKALVATMMKKLPAAVLTYFFRSEAV